MCIRTYIRISAACSSSGTAGTVPLSVTGLSETMMVQQCCKHVMAKFQPRGASEIYVTRLKGTKSQSAE